MAVIEPSAPLRLLRAGYAPDDWVAVFLKSYATGETCQRVVSISQVSRPEFLAWLRSRNASAWNVYVSVNGVSPRSRSRSRQSVAAVRHVFLEADEDGPRVLARIAARVDLPPPSYLLHSSKHRVHIFWGVAGFDIPRVEALQKQLARELKTDTAATSCSQLTRLPGLFYLKSPIVSTRHTTLCLQGIVYEAVTDTASGEALLAAPDGPPSLLAPVWLAARWADRASSPSKVGRM